MKFPGARDVEAFWECLRTNGVMVDLEHLADAQMLLLHVSLNPGPSPRLRLRNMLRAALVTNEAEIEIFGAAFSTYLQPHFENPTERLASLAGSDHVSEGEQGDNTEESASEPISGQLNGLPDFRSRYHGIIFRAGLSLAVACGFLLLVALFRSPGSRVEPATEMPTSTAAVSLPAFWNKDTLRVIAIVLGAVAIVTPMIFLLAKEYRRQAWIDRNIDATRLRSVVGARRVGEHKKLFDGPEIRRAAQSLRALSTEPIHAINQDDLDIVATVQESAKNGGLFQPVLKKAKNCGALAILIEQTNLHDHLSQLFLDAAESLTRNNVEVEPFLYARNPLIVNTVAGPSLELHDIAARDTQRLLLFIGSGDGFFRPTGSSIWPELQDVFATCYRKCLLSTKPVGDWGSREQRLLDDGFSLGTASPTALMRLAQIANDIGNGQLLDVTRDARTRRLRNMDVSILYDLKSSRVKALVGHKGAVRSCAVSAEANLVATGSSDATIRLWDRASGTSVGTLSGHTKGVNRIEFIAGGNALVSCSDDGTARVWDLQRRSSRVYAKGYADAVIEDVTVSADGLKLATASADGVARTWNLGTRSVLAHIRVHGGPCVKVVFAAGGASLITAGHGAVVQIWDTQTGQLQRNLMGHRASITSMAISARGDLLATGSFDKTVRIWNPSDGKCLAVLRGHTGWVRVVEFSPDGRLLVTCSDDRVALLWQTEFTGALPDKTLRGHGGTILCAAFSNDGSRLVTGSSDFSARVWNSSSGECAAVLNQGGRVYDSAFLSSSAEILTVGEGGVVAIWQLA
jgi:WD40 repeat protein